MAQIKYIKDLYENEEASLREISRITGHSFETVRKYAYQENWSEDNLPDIEPQSYPVLQDFIPIIDKWLEEDRKAPQETAPYSNADLPPPVRRTWVYWLLFHREEVCPQEEICHENPKCRVSPSGPSQRLGTGGL